MPFLPMEEKKPPKPPLPLGDVDPIHYTNAWADPTNHPKWQLDRYTHFRTNMPQTIHWLHWDAPHPFPKLLLVMG